jgi:maltose-binding protein MalE
MEAHAQDEWPICSSRCSPGGKKVMYNQPTTLEERISVAKDFVDAFQLKIPMMIDTMKNSFEELYAAWPLRIFIIKGGRIIFKAQPGEKMLEMTDIVNVLQSLKGSE